MQLANYYKALPPMSQFVEWLEKETDIKKVAEFDKCIEAAKVKDRANDERATFWGELGIWSARRMGQLLKEGKEQGVLYDGKRPPNRALQAVTVYSYKDLGFKNRVTPMRAQAIAAIDIKLLRKHIAEMKRVEKIITKASLTPLFNQERKAARAKTLKAMEWPKGKYRVIYADPAWAYNDRRLDSVAGGGASGSYETESTDAICARRVADLALKDAVLFLWVTSPLLPDGLKVINAWGFNYKASFVWDKKQGFNGHYNDVHHELLLVAVRGSCTPDRDELFPSVISEPKGKHSAKPMRFIEMIDAMYPLGPRIELYCRTKRDGWDAWGNEIG